MVWCFVTKWLPLVLLHILLKSVSVEVLVSSVVNVSWFETQMSAKEGGSLPLSLEHVS